MQAACLLLCQSAKVFLPFSTMRFFLSNTSFASSAAVLAAVVFLAALPSSAEAAVHVYVTNRSGDSLTVVDTTTKSVVFNMPVGDDPFAIVISGTGAYIANQNTDTVSLVDLTRHAIIATVAVGDSPQGIAVSGTGVYVSNSGDDTVSVIDTTSRTVDLTVTVGDAPSSIAVSGTGVYVVNKSGDSVTLIDRTDSRVVGSAISVGDAPEGVAISGTGVYVTNKNDDTVSVIDTESRQVDKTITVGDAPVGIAISGTGAYASNETGDSVSVIDTVEDRVEVGAISVGDAPKGVAASGTGVYVVNAGDNSVSVIDTWNRLVEATITVGSNPRAIAAGPDIDLSAPTLSSLSPADGATEAAVGDNLILVFSRIIGFSGTGTMSIFRSADDSLVETISVQSSQAHGSGTTTFSIDPSQALAYGTSYYVQVSPHAFPNLARIFYAGFNNATTWNFTTVAASSIGETQQSGGGVGGGGGVRKETLETRKETANGRFGGQESLLPAQPASHGRPSLAAAQEQGSMPFQKRTCERALRWFRNDAKMLSRVNGRLLKRFAFVCRQ